MYFELQVWVVIITVGRTGCCIYIIRTGICAIEVLTGKLCEVDKLFRIATYGTSSLLRESISYAILHISSEPSCYRPVGYIDIPSANAP